MTAEEVWTSPPIGEVDLLVVDTWQVIDKWWTNDPVARDWRVVVRDGVEHVESRDIPLGDWQIMEGW